MPELENYSETEARRLAIAEAFGDRGLQADPDPLPTLCDDCGLPFAVVDLPLVGPPTNLECPGCRLRVMGTDEEVAAADLIHEEASRG